jgi:two-component system, OmpR family, response regulator
MDELLVTKFGEGSGMRLLLVEDEPEMADAIIRVLSRHGNIVDHVPTIEQGREAIKSGVHNAILLDRKLPDGDGMALLAEIRQAGNTIPIILLTAHDTSKDRVEGLDRGADDYVGKPFVAEELMARIRAAGRRASNYSANLLSEANLSLDTNTLDTFVNGKALALPRREVLALQILLRRAGRTVMRTVLEEAVYGYDDEIQSNALDSHISRLRRRLADAGAGVAIHTVRGVGYILKETK